MLLKIWILSRTSISICLKIYTVFSYTRLKLKITRSFLLNLSQNLAESEADLTESWGRRKLSYFLVTQFKDALFSRKHLKNLFLTLSLHSAKQKSWASIRYGTRFTTSHYLKSQSYNTINCNPFSRIALFWKDWTK